MFHVKHDHDRMSSGAFFHVKQRPSVRLSVSAAEESQPVDFIGVRQRTTLVRLLRLPEVSV
jgi:hypothetical protein